MDRKDGWLGYVAVALGALALLVALLGSGGAHSVEIAVPLSGYRQMPQAVLAAPPATVVPAAPPLPPRSVAPPEELREAERREMEGLRDHFRGWERHGPGRPFAATPEEFILRGHDPWSAFWWPVAVAEMVLKLGVAILAIGIGMRLLRGRRGGHGHPPPPPGPPSMA